MEDRLTWGKGISMPREVRRAACMVYAPQYVANDRCDFAAFCCNVLDNKAWLLLRFQSCRDMLRRMRIL